MKFDKNKADPLLSIVVIIFSVFIGYISINYYYNKLNNEIEFNSIISYNHHVKKDKKIYTASYYDYSLPDYEGYSINHLTAASRDYPKGTRLKVTNVKNGKWVIVRVNDYGPEAWTKRDLDMSSAAFKQIAPLSQGLVKVYIEVVK